MFVLYVLLQILCVLPSASGQCQEDFSVAWPGRPPGFVVSSANLTCISAAFTGASATFSGTLQAGSARLSSSAAAAALATPSLLSSRLLNAGSVSVSGSVTATRFSGDASGLTALSSQPQFAALLATTNALNSSNTLKAAPAGSVINSVSPSGAFTSIAMQYMNGALSAACLTTTDCLSPLLCDRVTLRCAGAAGYACTSDEQCYTGLACTLNGVCSTPPASCTAIKTAYPSAPSGRYLLSLPRTPGGAYFWCNMVSADGAGWTLVWSNLRTGLGVPHPTHRMSFDSATTGGVYSWPLPNVLSGRPAAVSNQLEAFMVYTGLSFWRSLSPRGKIRYDWSPDFGQPVTQSWECSYTYFVPPSYTLTVSSCVARVGSAGMPGLFSYHAGRPFSAIDKEVSGCGTCCTCQYGTPFWYGCCWDGSISGDGDNNLGHSSAAYWIGSAAGYASVGGYTGGGNGWLYIS